MTVEELLALLPKVWVGSDFFLRLHPAWRRGRKTDDAPVFPSFAFKSEFSQTGYPTVWV